MLKLTLLQPTSSLPAWWHCSNYCWSRICSCSDCIPDVNVCVHMLSSCVWQNVCVTSRCAWCMHISNCYNSWINQRPVACMTLIVHGRLVTQAHDAFMSDCYSCSIGLCVFMCTCMFMILYYLKVSSMLYRSLFMCMHVIVYITNVNRTSYQLR